MDEFEDVTSYMETLFHTEKKTEAGKRQHVVYISFRILKGNADDLIKEEKYKELSIEKTFTLSESLMFPSGLHDKIVERLKEKKGDDVSNKIKVTEIEKLVQDEDFEYCSLDRDRSALFEGTWYCAIPEINKIKRSIFTAVRIYKKKECPKKTIIVELTTHLVFIPKLSTCVEALSISV